MLGWVAVALAGLVYLNALSNPFVYDDYVTVVTNPSLREWSSPTAILLQNVFRPVTSLSYAMDRALWGFRPFGYHLTSVALHLVNVALLFRLARRAAEDARTGVAPAAVAFVAASLFGVHPMMTEAVGYVSGRAEVLCATLFLGALLLARAGIVGGRPALIAGGLALAAGGLGAREVALMFPFVLLLYDNFLINDGMEAQRRRLLRLHLPLMGAAVAVGLARLAAFVWIETPALADSPGTPFTQIGAVARYLGLLLVPLSQSLVHATPRLSVALALATAAGLLLVVALAWRARRREPLLILGIAWFLLLLAPSMMVTLLEAVAEHRVYLASAGLFIAAGAVAGRGLAAPARGLRLAARTGLLVVLAVLCALTVARNAVWADPVRLWRDAAHKAPAEWNAHYGLANALAAQGDCEEAIGAYHRALRLARKPGVLSNLGACLAQEGRTAEARAAYRAALTLNPRYAPAHHNLALLALRDGDHESAHRHFLQALTDQPRDSAWRQALVTIYETRMGDPVKTLELCREISRVAATTPGVGECIARHESRAR